MKPMAEHCFTISLNPKDRRIGNKLNPEASFEEVREKIQHLINAWMIKGFFLNDEAIPRFAQYEESIAANPLAAAFYACCFLKRPWPEAEKLIAKDKEASMLYATKLLRKRFPAGEAAISEHPEYCLAYSVLLLKRGKLPDLMHNKMLAHGIKDPDNEHVRRYLRFKKVSA